MLVEDVHAHCLRYNGLMFRNTKFALASVLPILIGRKGIILSISFHTVVRVSGWVHHMSPCIFIRRYNTLFLGTRSYA